MRRRERWGRLAAAVAAAVLLAGCATVPTSGPVREHESDGQEIESGVKVAPVPPAPDASPMLVVEGFLHAMGTDQPGFAVARQYLTPAADAAWHPESGTLIYADGHQPREADTGTEERPSIILEAVLTGRLSATGEYREEGGGNRHDFGLQRNSDGQWRISRPPDGLLISRYHFQTNYVALNLHYLDATGAVLVPDPRYLALNALTPVALLDAQLAGPSEWLAPAVRKASWPASIVDDLDLLPQGVAVLRLRPEAAELSEDDLTALMAEFTTTLTMLPQIAGVQFSTGGNLLTLPGTSIVTLTASDLAQLAPARAGGRLLTVRDKVVHLTDAQEPWDEGQAVAPGLTSPGPIAARSDLAEIAAVNPEGTRLAVAKAEGDAETVLWEGERLLRPDYSRQDELWAIGGGSGADGFRVHAADRTILPVTVGPDFPADAVRAFRLSPDGTRIALVLDGPLLDGVPVEQVGLARVVRGAEGIAIEAFRPVTVSPPAEAARRIVDVGWQTATELLVLVSHRATPTASVVEVDQDSARAEDIGPSDVTGLSELAVAPGGQPVLRGIGAVYRFEGPFNWELTDLTAEAVTYS